MLYFQNQIKKELDRLKNGNGTEKERKWNGNGTEKELSRTEWERNGNENETGTVR